MPNANMAGSCHVRAPSWPPAPPASSLLPPRHLSKPPLRLQVLGRVLRLMRGGSPVAGSVFWMTAAPSCPDYDGFTIYLPPAPAPAPSLPQQAQQVQLAQHGAAAEQAPEKRGLAKALGKLSWRLLGGGSGGGPAAAEAAAEVQGSQQQAPASCSEEGTVQVILEHAAQVAQLNKQRSGPAPS